jgi:Ca2+-binding EF-hand superfamily protein
MADPRDAELREAFRQCDADGDGAIEMSEFVTLLQNLEAGASAREARIGFNAIDTDDDQAIDFEEFLAWWRER